MGIARSPLRVLALTMAALTCLLAGVARAPTASAADKPSYWLLVTFAVSGKPEEMALLKETTFEGVAVQIITAYDTGPTPTADAIAEKLGTLKEAAHRDVWPWVFVNRIQKLDVGGQARQPFLDDWRAALQAARRLGSAGVVLDLEFYSNPGLAYAISRFAAQTGTSAPEAARRLEALGRDMAQITAREFPNARIWVLTSGLDTADDERVGGQSFYQPRAHIVLGILQELARTNGAATVIDGGEDTLGYCHANLAALQQAINRRPQKEARVLGLYRHWLAFAGTIAPWTDKATKKGWLAEADCGAAQADQAEEFTPYLKLLDKTYAFDWMYAAPVGGYQPFNREVSARFDKILRGARGAPPRSSAQ
ncbi:MAG: hypothetical protein JO184_15780 [Gammaproteobacteria bacterium]|nr:hypothetical protein [Gammaproteobacteria bacterium]